MYCFRNEFCCYEMETEMIFNPALAALSKSASVGQENSGLNYAGGVCFIHFNVNNSHVSVIFIQSRVILNTIRPSLKL